MLGISQKPSTAFHPQTDGQTEAANKEMERYLRTYVDYHQQDWVEWLPLAEFAANAMRTEATEHSPFFLTTGQDPKMDFDVDGLQEPQCSSMYQRETATRPGTNDGYPHAGHLELRTRQYQEGTGKAVDSC